MKMSMRFFRKLALCLSAALLLFILAVVGFYGIKGYVMYRNAVNEKTIEERVEEVRGRESFTAYSDLPDFYVSAVVSAEDRRFAQHFGIDPIAVGRALWNDIRAMSFVEGGSTITQQLAKNLLFTQKKKIERKAAEVFAALAIKKSYTKAEIFELYVNTAYFGNGYYGIGEAAMGYFGKTPGELTDYECAMLAGLPQAPSAYSPDTHRELAEKRMGQVLRCMVRNKAITKEEADRIAGEQTAAFAAEGM